MSMHAARLEQARGDLAGGRLQAEVVEPVQLLVACRRE